jgi:hypothetical protein
MLMALGWPSYVTREAAVGAPTRPPVRHIGIRQVASGPVMGTVIPRGRQCRRAECRVHPEKGMWELGGWRRSMLSRSSSPGRTRTSE